MAFAVQHSNFPTLIFSDVLNLRSWMKGFPPTLDGRTFDEFMARWRVNSVRVKRNQGAWNFPECWSSSLLFGPVCLLLSLKQESHAGRGGGGRGEGIVRKLALWWCNQHPVVCFKTKARASGSMEKENKITGHGSK